MPVHPADRHFLGVWWQEQTYVDMALPFGLRSAPIIFSAVADALLWVMYQRGISSGLHYLDDYLFFGRPRSHEGAKIQERCSGDERSVRYAGGCPQGQRPDNAAGVSGTGTRYGGASAASPSGEAKTNGSGTRSLVEEVILLASGTAVPCWAASARVDSGAGEMGFSAPPN